MMNLRQYIESFPRGERAELRRKIAKKLNVSEIYIEMIYAGIRKLPSKYALQIHEMTDGKVPCWETAPDIYPRKMFDKSLEKKTKKKSR